MYFNSFESLRDFVGSELGATQADLSVSCIASVSQVSPLVDKVKKLCTDAYKEFELNSLGLNKKTQISYIEDLLYIIDNEMRLYNICTHSSRWETWLAYHLKKLQGEEPVESEIKSLHLSVAKYSLENDEYHISSIESNCTSLAVRAYFEHIHSINVHDDKIIVTNGLTNHEHLELFDKEFLREYVRILIDNEIFFFREKIHKKYSFKGGKRISRWFYWYEKESNYHSSEKDSISLIFNARNSVTLPSSPPPLVWGGSGTELLDLFVSLNEKGYIKLPLPGESGGISLERIAKAICSLFDVSNTRRKDSKSSHWVTIYQYLKETSLDRVTKQYTHDRLKEGKRSFDCISPPKPRPKSSN